MAYRYERTLNNNAIIAVDEAGEEAILLGRGIALHCSRGRFSTVSEDLIERVFTLGLIGQKVCPLQGHRRRPMTPFLCLKSVRSF